MILVFLDIDCSPHATRRLTERRSDASEGEGSPWLVLVGEPGRAGPSSHAKAENVTRVRLDLGLRAPLDRRPDRSGHRATSGEPPKAAPPGPTCPRAGET